MTLKCKWHIKMKLKYVDNTVASLLMELLTLQMFAEELSVSVKWEKNDGNWKYTAFKSKLYSSQQV